MSSDGLLRRITALQEAGHVTNAKVTTDTGRGMTLVLELTSEGVESIIMKDPIDALDTEFLQDQIAEYQDQVPKAFLEGLKAAEGILRGTDCLENYIED